MGNLKFWPVKGFKGWYVTYLFDSLRRTTCYVSSETLEVHFIGTGDAAGMVP
jgi:hypothetical protein